MGATSIEWTDHSINPIRFGLGHFCQKISPGCANCYASRFQPRIGNAEFKGAGGTLPIVLTNGKTNGPMLWLDDSKLEEVLRRRKPTRYFWCDMTDLFGAWVPDEFIDKCFAVMAATPWHTHQVLTKRADRMRDYLTWGGRPMRLAAAVAHLGPILEDIRGDWSLWSPTITGLRNQYADSWPLRNVWIGFSAEDQERFDGRAVWVAPLMCAGWTVFVSAEPLLGPILMQGWDGQLQRNWLDDPGIRWVIVGGESGPGARPCHVGWVRSLAQQCKQAGVACFVKQLGKAPRPSHLPSDVCVRFIRHPKGGNPSEWPADLRVHEFPEDAKDNHG